MRRLVIGLILAMIVLSVSTSTVRGATTIYVDASAGGAGTGSSWTDAYTNLQDALAAAVAGADVVSTA